MKHLPPNLRRLIKVIGLERTVQLLLHYKGTCVLKVPKHRSATLTQVIGEESTQKLLRSELAGEVIEVSILAINHQLRDAVILSHYENGMKVIDIARHMQLSRRVVHRVVSGEAMPLEPRNFDLFDEPENKPLH